jgi:alkylation response protein AidB-like acyl-CoA dehydrogenase
VQIYNAPIDEFRFLLETLGYHEVQALGPYGDYDLDTVVSLLRAAGDFCRDVALPLNRKGDQLGLRYDPVTGSVTLPEGFRGLYQRYVEAGFSSLGHPPEYGGGGAPHAVATLVQEMLVATNKSFSMCPALSQGLIEALAHHGTEDQRARYLPKLISGEWTGTMCLTEPHCGTDLGLLTTRAVPDGERYRLTGTKIWITFGEHDLTENIVHLVLARLPNAPAGIKGISVFVVPKVLPDGTRNGIHCSGLEHKMGIHASPTCVMTLEDAVGELVGEPHRGMRTMFIMMNAARLNVGLEGIALGEIAYQTALAFARDRRQGKAPNPARREHGAAADNILVHPDVRRMLLEIKATNEAMRALALWTSLQIDTAAHHPDPARRQAATDMAALLTPVVKSFCTERGFFNVSTAMQVCGGAGFTTDWSIEQYLRDLRIAMIYEGTNHIQALDLVGRKLPADGGRGYRDWSARIAAFCEAHAGNAEMVEFVKPLQEALATLDGLSAWLGGGSADGETVGAAASPYLNVFALTALAFMWGLQVVEARRRDTPHAATKVKTARYYYRHVLPEIDTLARIAREGSTHVMALEADEF